MPNPLQQGYPVPVQPQPGYSPAGPQSMFPPVVQPPVAPKIFLPTALKDAVHFFQVPARRWWWGLIGLAMLGALFFIVQIVMGIVLALADPVFTAAALRGEIVTTPTVFLLNNISIALFIGIAVLVSWAIYRQGFGWLASVVGRMRWRWLGQALVVFLIGYAAYYGVMTVVSGPEGVWGTELGWRPTSLLLIVGILLTTPFQAAGEEFFFRGAMSRLIAGVIPARRVGLVLAAIISSAAFMLAHAAGDPWLNLYYFSVGLLMWWLCYRTGGLEAGIAFHVVNNLIAEISLPFTDISGMFDRQAGAGSAWMLIDIAFQIVMVVVIDFFARRRGLVRASSPAALTPQVARPKRWFTPVGSLVTDATEVDLPRLATTVRETPAPVAPPMWGYPPMPMGPVPPAQGVYPWAQGGYPSSQGVYPSAQGGYAVPPAGYPSAPPTPPAAAGYPSAPLATPTSVGRASDLSVSPAFPPPVGQPIAPVDGWLPVPEQAPEPAPTVGPQSVEGSGVGDYSSLSPVAYAVPPSLSDQVAPLSPAGYSPSMAPVATTPAGWASAPPTAQASTGYPSASPATPAPVEYTSDPPVSPSFPPPVGQPIASVDGWPPAPGQAPTAGPQSVEGSGMGDHSSLPPTDQWAPPAGDPVAASERQLEPPTQTDPPRP